MDLSKAYDCFTHYLLLAKLGAYGFGRSSLRLLIHYLYSCKQQTEVGLIYSNWPEIKRGILQAFILGTLLFNIFINDLFFVIEKSDICNFDDDNNCILVEQI